MSRREVVTGGVDERGRLWLLVKETVVPIWLKKN